MSPFEFRERHGVSYFLCRPLERFSVTAVTSTRLGGVSPLPKDALNLGYFQGDLPENVSENRRRFLKAVGLKGKSLLTMRQKHTDHVLVIEDEGISSDPPACDALITSSKSLALCVQTADCLPILIFDSRNRARAAIHAGWRGTLRRVSEKTLEAMAARYGTRGEDCYAAIGPAIHRCCYEVGPEVIESFVAEFPYADSLISNHKESGKAHLDLIEANVRQLLDCALPPSHLYLSEECTACNPHLFFSYRREGRSNNHVGRLLSVICDEA